MSENTSLSALVTNSGLSRAESSPGWDGPRNEWLAEGKPQGQPAPFLYGVCACVAETEECVVSSHKLDSEHRWEVGAER